MSMRCRSRIRGPSTAAAAARSGRGCRSSRAANVGTTWCTASGSAWATIESAPASDDGVAGNLGSGGYVDDRRHLEALAFEHGRPRLRVQRPTGGEVGDHDRHRRAPRLGLAPQDDEAPSRLDRRVRRGRRDAPARPWASCRARTARARPAPAGRDRREVIGDAVGSDLEALAESRCEQPPSGFGAVHVEAGLCEVTDQVSLATLGVEHSAFAPRSCSATTSAVGAGTGTGSMASSAPATERLAPGVDCSTIDRRRSSMRSARRRSRSPNELTWFARYCMYQKVSLRTPFLT